MLCFNSLHPTFGGLTGAGWGMGAHVRSAKLPSSPKDKGPHPQFIVCVDIHTVTPTETFQCDQQRSPPCNCMCQNALPTLHM